MLDKLPDDILLEIIKKFKRSPEMLEVLLRTNHSLRSKCYNLKYIWKLFIGKDKQSNLRSFSKKGLTECVKLVKSVSRSTLKLNDNLLSISLDHNLLSSIYFLNYGLKFNEYFLLNCFKQVWKHSKAIQNCSTLGLHITLPTVKHMTLSNHLFNQNFCLYIHDEEDFRFKKTKGFIPHTFWEFYIAVYFNAYSEIRRYVETADFKIDLFSVEIAIIAEQFHVVNYFFINTPDIFTRDFLALLLVTTVTRCRNSLRFFEVLVGKARVFGYHDEKFQRFIFKLLIEYVFKSQTCLWWYITRHSHNISMQVKLDSIAFAIQKRSVTTLQIFSETNIDCGLIRIPKNYFRNIILDQPESIQISLMIHLVTLNVQFEDYEIVFNASKYNGSLFVKLLQSRKYVTFFEEYLEKNQEMKLKALDIIKFSQFSIIEN